MLFECFEIFTKLTLLFCATAKLHQLVEREQESATGSAEAAAQICKNTFCLGTMEGGCGNQLPQNSIVASALENVFAVRKDNKPHSVNKHLSPTEELANVICREEEHSATLTREEAEFVFNTIHRYAVGICGKGIFFATVGKVKSKCAVIGYAGECHCRGNGCHRQPKRAVFFKRNRFAIVDRVRNALAVNNGIVARFGEHSGSLELGHSCINGSDITLVNIKAIDVKNRRTSLGGHVHSL